MRPWVSRSIAPGGLTPEHVQRRGQCRGTPRGHLATQHHDIRLANGSHDLPDQSVAEIQARPIASGTGLVVALVAEVRELSVRG